MRRDTEQLITAYVDGVAELTADERRRVEERLARDPAARAESAATRTLLDRLRELPAEGTEPDWAAMERSIDDAVGNAVPRPWWRNWKWVVPLATIATATAIVLATWSQRAPAVATVPPTIPAAPSADHVAAPLAPSPAEVVPLWLDGSEVEVEASPDTIGAIEAIEGELGIQNDGLPDAAGVDDASLLPTTDLAWVDGLDDAALDRAEQWLAQRKKG